MSADAKLFTQGTHYQQLQLWSNTITSFPRVRLSTSPTPPAVGDVYPATYTEPSMTGYSAIFTAALSTTFATADVYTDVAFSPITFTFDPYAGPVETVYHWWIEDAGYGYLLWYGTLPTPFTIPLGGGTLTIDPLTLRQEQCPATSPPPPPYLLFATFDAPNGTPLTSYVPEIGPTGTTFNDGGSITAAVQCHSAQLTHAGHASSGVLWDVGESDVTITCWMVLQPTSEDGGVIVRATDEDNYLLVDLDGTGDDVVLYQRVGGTYSALASTPLSRGGGGLHYVSVGCDSMTVNVAVDGVDMLSYGSATFNLTATKVGIFQGGEVANDTIQFTNIAVV